MSSFLVFSSLCGWNEDKMPEACTVMEEGLVLGKQSRRKQEGAGALTPAETLTVLLLVPSDCPHVTQKLLFCSGFCDFVFSVSHI